MKIVLMTIVSAMVLFAAHSGAYALTLKPGQVISGDTGQVADASETSTGQAKLADDGVLVAGGMVFIDLNGETIEVPVADIRGKSPEQIAEVIGDAAVEQLIDLYDDAEAHVAEIIEQGGDAINAVGKTAEEIAEHIKNSDAVTGAVVGVSEATHEAIQDILADEIVIDANGEAYNPNNGPCSGAGC